MDRVILVAFLIFLCLLGCGLACQPPQPLAGTKVDLDTPHELYTLHWVDSSTGWLGGGLRFDENRLMRTDDGGQSWRQQLVDTFLEKAIFDLDALDAQRGVAGSMDGYFLTTENGGTTWRLDSLPLPIRLRVPLRSVALLNDSLIVAVGGNGYSQGLLVRSSDFGRSWTLVDTPRYELRQVQFLDERRGYASGYGGVLRSQDGGQSWTLSPASGDFFAAMHFPSRDTGYVGGRNGRLLVTYDGAQSWRVLRRGNVWGKPEMAFRELYFVDATTGYAVGDEGLLAKTTDGGAQWQRLETPFSDALNAVYAWREGRGWVAGEGGALWQFAE